MNLIGGGGSVADRTVQIKSNIPASPFLKINKEIKKRHNQNKEKREKWKKGTINLYKKQNEEKKRKPKLSTFKKTRKKDIRNKNEKKKMKKLKT